MKSMIINLAAFDMGIPEHILRMLPYRLSDTIRRMGAQRGDTVCEEIRLRCGRMSSLTLSGGENLPLRLSPPLTRDEIDRTVELLSGGSLYAHGDTIRQGYISLDGGIRAGLCGRAAYDGGRMIGVNDISGICIRLPHSVKVDASPVVGRLRDKKLSGGVLIYSPPGVGKTTLLRATARELSALGDKRVVVVDSRGELEFGLSGGGICLDVLSGYSKAEGIEIALRTLNADVIICDEIGNREDVGAICDAANGGAALVASAHAYDVPSLLHRKNVRSLIDGGVFSALVGIDRKGGGYSYSIDLTGELEL